MVISVGIFSVGIAFAVISNSDEAKIRELIFAYQNMLNNEEIEKVSTIYSEQAIFMPPEIPAINVASDNYIIRQCKSIYF